MGVRHRFRWFARLGWGSVEVGLGLGLASGAGRIEFVFALESSTRRGDRRRIRVTCPTSAVPGIVTGTVTVRQRVS